MRVIVLLLSVFAATMVALTIFASDWRIGSREYSSIARDSMSRRWPASALEGSKSRTPS